MMFVRLWYAFVMEAPINTRLRPPDTSSTSTCRQASTSRPALAGLLIATTVILTSFLKVRRTRMQPLPLLLEGMQY